MQTKAGLPIVALLLMSAAMAGCTGQDAPPHPAEPSAPAAASTGTADGGVAGDAGQDAADPPAAGPSEDGDAPPHAAPNAQGMSPLAPSAPDRRPVVMGFLERGGANVYHAEFRRPDWTAHPTTYIPGYPEAARPLRLSLDAPDLDTALALDAAVWAAMEPEALYYVPGTLFVGLAATAAELPYEFESHATTVMGAAVQAAAASGDAPAIVAFADAPWVTAARLEKTPWVDLISVSYATQHPAAAPRVDAVSFMSVNSPLMHLVNISVDGRAVISAAGNGGAGVSGWLAPFNAYAPPGALSVGELAGDNASVQLVGGRLADVVGPSSGMYPSHDQLAGYTSGYGTSFSAPRVAGHAAVLLAEVRTAWRDDHGSQGGALAVAPAGTHLPAQGPLADGLLEGDELLAVIRQAARALMPAESLQESEVRYLVHGYGNFDGDSMEPARAALWGETVEPRPWDDYWFRVVKEIAWRYWGPWACREYTDAPDWLQCPTGLENAVALVETLAGLPV